LQANAKLFIVHTPQTWQTDFIDAVCLLPQLFSFYLLLFVCLFVCLFVYLFVYLFIYLMPKSVANDVTFVWN